jgi:molecular chaperone GrpE
VADTVSEILPIIDNLERAAAYSADSSVKEGIVMIFKSVEAVFSKLGIEAYGARGEKFDPNLHNAVMHEDNSELGEGEISEVFQKGYKKGNKIIRFAMVKTAN